MFLFPGATVDTNKTFVLHVSGLPSGNPSYSHVDEHQQSVVSDNPQLVTQGWMRESFLLSELLVVLHTAQMWGLLSILWYKLCLISQ